MWEFFLFIFAFYLGTFLPIFPVLDFSWLLNWIFGVPNLHFLRIWPFFIFSKVFSSFLAKSNFDLGTFLCHFAIINCVCAGWTIDSGRRIYSSPSLDFSDFGHIAPTAIFLSISRLTEDEAQNLTWDAWFQHNPPSPASNSGRIRFSYLKSYSHPAATPSSDRLQSTIWRCSGRSPAFSLSQESAGSSWNFTVSFTYFR